MEWLLANGAQFTKNTVTLVVEHGNIKNMKWLLENP